MTRPVPMFPFTLTDARPLQLSGAPVDVRDYEAFEAFLAKCRATAPALIGGYDEDRAMYGGSDLFSDEKEEPRTIHLGVDVWTEAGTPISAPRAGTIHSFANNDNFGDYGATIILEHEGPIFTLYGHLSRRSLVGKKPGQPIEAGQTLAWLGDRTENGGWPPHLHFQLITDMMDFRGDFPGVARRSERERWLRLCPDPSALMI